MNQPMLTARRQVRRPSRGFTLVEMMAVVIIVAVLATIAVFAVRKYVWSAKTAEAFDMINAIKSAQEAYREETFRYLNVSGSLATYYPTAAPKNGKVAWNDSSNAGLQQGWLQLGVSASSAVVFRYSTVAGAVAGTGAPAVTGLGSPNFQLPSAVSGPWYVVQAVGDQDADGVDSVFISSSFAPDVFSEHEAE